MLCKSSKPRHAVIETQSTFSAVRRGKPLSTGSFASLVEKVGYEAGQDRSRLLTSANLLRINDLKAMVPVKTGAL